MTTPETIAARELAAVRLAEHALAGAWVQSGDSYHGECRCGAGFSANDYHGVRREWAKHAFTAADLTTLAAERDRLAGEVSNLQNAQIALAADLAKAREGLETAWRGGFQCARDCVSDDAAFELTEDVEGDAWLDSATRKASVVDDREITPNRVDDRGGADSVVKVSMGGERG